MNLHNFICETQELEVLISLDLWEAGRESQNLSLMDTDGFLCNICVHANVEDFGQGRELIYVTSSQASVVWVPERGCSQAVEQPDHMGAFLGNVSLSLKNANKAPFWEMMGLLPFSEPTFPLLHHDTILQSSFFPTISLEVIWGVVWIPEKLADVLGSPSE